MFDTLINIAVKLLCLSCILIILIAIGLSVKDLIQQGRLIHTAILLVLLLPISIILSEILSE